MQCVPHRKVIEPLEKPRHLPQRFCLEQAGGGRAWRGIS